MEESFYLYKLFNFCTSCSENHSLRLACGEKRDELDEEHPCHYCDKRHSYLNYYIHPDDRYPTIGECRRLIDDSFEEHFCEPRVIAMIINRDRDTCQMCVKEQFPNGANQENTQSVECKDFLHSKWLCRRFCVFCFMHKGELNEHYYLSCKKVPQDVKYRLEEYRDHEYGFD